MAELLERSGVEVELASPGGCRLVAHRPDRRERVFSLPVELLLPGRVAVGGVPAVEVLAGFAPQPLDGAVVEPGRGG